MSNRFLHKIKSVIVPPKRRLLATVLVVALYVVLVLPITERIAFTPPASEYVSFMVLLKIGFFALLVAMTYGILSFINQVVYKHDAFHRKWLKFSLIYLGVATLFFVLLYPGHWVWDEFNILYAVQHYVPDAWQNIYTNIYYTYCLYLIPTGVSIVAFQGLIAAIVVGYLLAQSEKFTNKRIWKVALFAVFLLPPVLINNLYPLRLTVYSYIELAFIIRFLLLLLNKERPTNAIIYSLQAAAMITLLAFWRSEGIYYLLTLPIIFVQFGYFTRQTIKKMVTISSIILSLVIVGGGYTINKITTNDRYALTAMINPLSIMIQHPLKGNNVDQRLQNIDKVINLSILKQYPSYTEIPAFWAGAVRDDYQQHLSQFRKSYIKLVMDNPQLFLDARMKTFLATNGFDVTTPTPMGMLSFSSYSDPHSAEIVNRFYNTNFLSHPINQTLKRDLTRDLLFLDSKDHVGFFGRIFWSVIPLIVVLLGVAIVALIKKQWIWLLVFSLILMRAGILFLTAPAHYFMYYLPVLMSGSSVLILWLVLQLGKKKSRLAHAK